MYCTLLYSDVMNMTTGLVTRNGGRGICSSPEIAGYQLNTDFYFPRSSNEITTKVDFNVQL